jgi:DNA-binding Xre family transcriptional regulator
VNQRKLSRVRDTLLIYWYQNMIPSIESSVDASRLVVQSIRAALRQRGMTYRELASALGVSEPTIKRDFSRGDFSLSRLDRICAVLDLTLGDLVQGSATPTAALSQLSERQERALVRDPRLLVVTYLLVNDWKLHEVSNTFALDENALIAVLLRLDELQIISYRPPNRIKKLTARNFSWRKDGPVHEFFITRVAPEFLHARFDEPSDELHFIGGTLSVASLARMKMSIIQLVEEFEELARRDSKLPLAVRDGCSALLALRKWEFSEFTRLRRR